MPLTRPDLSSALSPREAVPLLLGLFGWVPDCRRKEERGQNIRPCPGCLSPWELLPCADPSEMTPHLREQEAASAPWHGAAGRGPHARISTAQGMDEGCTRAGRPQRNTPGLAELWFVAESFPPAPPVHWEVGRTWDPAPTSPQPSAPQFSSANQTEFTWEPQPRVRGGDRRYLCPHVTGIPAKHGTQLEAVNRGSGRAAAGRRGTFSPAAASIGTRGGGAELPRGARVWDTHGAGACLIFLEGSLARQGVPPRLASRGSSSLWGHSCWARPAPGPRVAAACP